MKRLSKAKFDKYLEHPERCPFCGSADIEAQDAEPGETQQDLFVPVECFGCGTRYKTVLTVSGIMY